MPFFSTIQQSNRTLYISISWAFFLADISYFCAVLQKSGVLVHARTEILFSKGIPKLPAVCYNTDGATQTVGGRFLAPERALLMGSYEFLSLVFLVTICIVTLKAK